ncbi:hypothetical protein CDAR_1551 [Caerostris darwini]|uniref:Uncharacterized protein n=1 Tax=Caerostris darwini TaxID=1538125 RepID=A0AAV4R8R6_9ARAC|nr:hypothetical protein CDAR_1551 [Caerostris darwini]
MHDSVRAQIISGEVSIRIQCIVKHNTLCLYDSERDLLLGSDSIVYNCDCQVKIGNGGKGMQREGRCIERTLKVGKFF